MISIHTPTQGVTLQSTYRIHKTADFNPHSHAGSDAYICSKIKPITISIHTPTQGVTCRELSASADEILISIHTPTQGVTSLYCA